MILLNGKLVKVTTFPNGEAFINTDELEYKYNSNNVLTLKFERDEDLVHLMFIKRFLDTMKSSHTILNMPYVPYSRMDRTEGITVFTLKYMSELINGLKFDEIHVYEPHSDVCVALLDNVIIHSVTKKLVQKAMEEMAFNSSVDYLYFPDASAEKHFGKLFSSKSLIGLKERDFTTGTIKSLQVVGDITDLKEGFKVIMIDDLSSKGGTFLLGATRLKELGAKDIRLVVTHCEPTIFKGDILTSDLIKKVYTTDSIHRDEQSDKIETFKLYGEDNILSHHKIVLNPSKDIIDRLEGTIYKIDDLKNETILADFKEKLLIGRSNQQLVNLIVLSVQDLKGKLEKELVDEILCNARCIVTEDGKYHWTDNFLKN